MWKWQYPTRGQEYELQQGFQVCGLANSCHGIWNVMILLWKIVALSQFVPYPVLDNNGSCEQAPGRGYLVHTCGMRTDSVGHQA